MSYPASNWFAFPADLLLLLRDKSANKAQDLILIYIATRTWGTKAKKDEDPKNEVHWAVISITDFVRELMLSTRQVEEMIADALKRGLVSVRKAGNQRLYQLAPQNWKDAPDYAAEPDAAEPDAAEPDAAEPDAAEPVYNSQKMVASIGKRCRAVPLHFVMKGIESPVKLRMECAVIDPTLDAIEVSATARDGGLLRLEFSRAGQTEAGENKANEPRTAVRGSRPPTKQFHSHSASDNYANFLKTQLVSVYKHPYTQELLQDVLSRVSGAPFEDYTAKVAERKKRAEKSREQLDHRVLLWCADDVGAAFSQRAELERQAAKPSADRPPKPLAKMSGDELRAWVASLSEDERAQLFEREPLLAESL